MQDKKFADYTKSKYNLNRKQVVRNFFTNLPGLSVRRQHAFCIVYDQAYTSIYIVSTNIFRYKKR